MAVMPFDLQLQSAVGATDTEHLEGLGSGRRIAVLAVHHVHVSGQILTGGAEKYVQQVIRALNCSGASVHVGYSGVSIYDELLEETDPNRLTVEQTGWLDELLRGDRRFTISLLRKRRRWLRATGADTLFAIQQDSGAAFFTSLIAARSLGMRVVSSIRQMPPAIPQMVRRLMFRMLPVPGFWRRRVTRRHRWPARLCDAVILNSRRVADSYVQQCGLDSQTVRVIHNGEPPRPKSRSRIGRKCIHIATAGRVTPAKGSDVLYAAFKVVASRYPNARLLYFGEGSLATTLRERAKADGLDHRVQFAGYIADREEMHEQIDIYVQASLREAMSNSVIEAMARGKPCIVSDVGGLPEAVEHGVSGYVVPAGCEVSLSQAISAIMMEEGAIDRIGDAARLRAARLFDSRRFEVETVSTILGIENQDRR